MRNRPVIERDVALAKAHVVKGAELVRQQRELVTKLEANGRDATEAKKLLALFEQIQALHLGDCDRWLKELAGVSDWRRAP